MLSTEFLNSFSSISDPRRIEKGHIRHKLEDIFAISILGVICGADNWVELAEFAESRQEWLGSFLELPYGIPSHDTFGRVFSSLDSSKFEQAFSKWSHSLTSLDISGEAKLQREIIAIDGKSSRRSHDRKNGIKPLHMVSAWAVNQGLVLGQVSTDVKSNEIEAIPRLLNMVSVENAIVTIDAMGCQKSIAKDIKKRGGEYILSLKDNHPTLAKVVKDALADAASVEYKDIPYLRQIEKDKAHGRIEKRTYTLLSINDKLIQKTKWPHIRSIAVVESKRTINHETSRATRYFVTSLKYHQMADFMRGVRNHWHVENNLHWSLDVSFDDDLNRARTGNSQENLSIMKRIALNLINRENSSKIGIKAKRKKASWSNKFLAKIIQNS